MKKVLVFLLVIVVLVFVLGITGWFLIGPVGGSNETIQFTVPQDDAHFDVAQALLDQIFIRNKKAFLFLLDNFAIGKEIKPGGYRLTKTMNSWQILIKLTGKPDLLWFKFSYCLRKEQIGEQLAELMGWSEDELTKWDTIYTNTKPEYFEGVYYPDTYLLPTDENGAQIAQRFTNHFNEKFTPFADQFAAKNIKWTTGLKIASLIAREAADKSDMKLISGIIWNRLNDNMPLQIDSTMQYTLGKNPTGGWWGTIDISQKQSDSPYNSYKHIGLPPTPICSPNTDAIEAALNPEETDCLFYLHDKSKQIHCAKTYTEHLENIKKYLD